MLKPSVTVIVPLLNAEKYIRGCMDSVIGQSMKEMEILCIDAGSDDGTLDILEEYALSDRRVKIIQSGVKSYGRQVNMGVDLARGKYVAVVEADDFIDSSMYEKLYAVAKEYGLDFVKADFMGFRSLRNGQRCYDSGRVFTDEGLYGKVLSSRDFPGLYLRDVNIWKGIYNRQFLISNNIRLNETPGAAFQDIGFCHLLLLYAEKGMYLKDTLYFYRRDNGESSSRMPCGLQFAYQEYSRLLDIRIISENIKLFYHYLYIRMVHVFIGEYEKMLEHCTDLEGKFREAVEWFISILGVKMAEGEITEKCVGKEAWEKLCLLINGEKAFVEKWRNGREKRGAEEKALLNRIGKEEVVIFGCGRYGKKCLLFCDEHQVEIAAFCDNAIHLWGTLCCGYTVCMPTELKLKYPDRKILLSIPGHEAAVRAQLEEMGIDRGRVLTYSGMD